MARIASNVCKENECEEEKTGKKEGRSKNDEVVSPMLPSPASSSVIKFPDKILNTGINKILLEVPKTYRVKAHSLMKHLVQMVIPSRLKWNENRVVTIDGKFVPDSNIVDLVNKATHERKYAKATGRLQFVRLL